MKHFYSLIFLILLLQHAGAQRVCGTDSYLREHPIRQMQGQHYASFRDTIPNEIISIPVVVHILFNSSAQNISDAQVLSQIAVLNKDFRYLNDDAINTPAAFKGLAADTRINFCMARVDPNGRPTNGIVRRYTSNPYFMGNDGMKFSASGGDDAWDSRKYLNIWVCNMMGRSLGYATMPGAEASKDGIVINYDVFGTVGNLRAPFNLGRTTTHEVGHWLGLKHLWGDDDCGSDDVDDTPPQRSYNYNCPAFPHTTVCSSNSFGDMFMNYMDFTNDACMNLFSIGQKNKMRGIFAERGFRNSFLNSYACDSTYASGGPLPNDTLPVAPPAVIISLYPNPAHDYVQVSSSQPTALTGKPAMVYAASGVLMSTTILNTNPARIYVGQLPTGIYFVKVGGNRKMVKLIKN